MYLPNLDKGPAVQGRVSNTLLHLIVDHYDTYCSYFMNTKDRVY